MKKNKTQREIIFENPNTDDDRKIRADKKKKGGAGKTILIVISFLAVALATFLITIKIAQPDFKLTQLIPEQAQHFVDEKLLGNTTTGAPTSETVSKITSETTTKAETTAPAAAYLPIEDFAFKTDIQGNYMGNILAGGIVGTDASYIYHIADKRGIYRFEPQGEGYTRIFKTEDKLSSLNLRGEYLYFVNEENNALYRLKKGSSQPEKLADSAKLAYVYDKTIYYITAENKIAVMNTEKLKEKIIYSEPEGEVNLVGISLKAVFFTEEQSDGSVKYLTVDNKGKSGPQGFRQETERDELVAPVLENGFLYYYELQDDGSYNLCRQKYGSQRVVTLVEAATSLCPAIVDKNRLFYGELDGKRFNMVELNMNSKKTKIMLFTRNAGSENELICQHGGQYDFIIGKKNSNGDFVYIGSCVDTGSANIMAFNDGSWSY